MPDTLIHNATIINEGKSFKGDLLIKDEHISAIALPGQIQKEGTARIIDAAGLMLIPGVIDDHVHFREPGLTHKADIFIESKAAAAGGITSFMDMPNTIPPAVSINTLNDKYLLASERSLINYSFYIGATNENLGEIMQADPEKVCGVKLFMGSSTGNILLDDRRSLMELFRKAHIPVAAHCEDEETIRKNTRIYSDQYGENIPADKHPLIRSRDACYIASARAVELAREFNTRLHILHLSTADEMKLFNNDLPVGQKRITAEVCVHHLWFDESYYSGLGTFIKWNPAIKTRFDKDALTDSLRNDIIDVIATDHAPHTAGEKTAGYFRAPSGGPMVQHSLPIMFELYHKKILPVEKIIEKMCHNPAIIFNVRNRGFIREGYKADLCLVDPDDPWTVSKENIVYKCGWSPLEGTVLRARVIKTFVNGTLVYDNGLINEEHRGQRLLFDRLIQR